MKNIKILSKIHLYLSIPVGIVISIICLTGAGLVLYKDIHKLFNADLYKIEVVENAPLSMNVLVDKLLTQLPAKDTVTRVMVYADEGLSYQFQLKNSRGEFFVNQYTGEFLGSHHAFKDGGFYQTMFYTHRWLMNYNRDFSWGKQIVGVSTLILIFVIITGFFIWLPRGIYSLKKGLSICTKRGWSRFFYDLHVAGGMYIAGWLLILALTGLMWSFSWYRPMVGSLFGIEFAKKSSIKAKSIAQKESPIKYELWDNVLREIKANDENLIYTSINQDRAYSYNNVYGNTRSYDTYSFSRIDGKIDEVELYSSKPESSRFMGWMYSIHVGTWGGLMSRIATFIVSFLGGVLPITGYYFWIKKELRKRKRIRLKGK